MEFKYRLPKEFFSKVRPHVQPSNNPDDEITPIKWSKNIRNGKYKNKTLVNLAKSNPK